jgi:hypothetical protein
MPDSQFDDFVGRQLSDLSAPVPDGLWQRLNEQQFDQFFREKLGSYEAPIDESSWQKITDRQFDNHISDQLQNFIAPVPSGAFEQLDDTRLDRFFGNSFQDFQAPVPANTWDAIAGQLLDTHAGEQLKQYEQPVADNLWDKIADQQFDSHLSASLTNVEVPVPAGLWDKIADQQFDEHFSVSLKNYEAPVSEELWRKIKPEEDDDRGFFYWFRIPMAAAIAGALFLGGLFATYVVYKKNFTPPTDGQSGVVISGDGSQTPPTGNEKSEQPEGNRAIIPPASIDSIDNRSTVNRKKINLPLADEATNESSADRKRNELSEQHSSRNWSGWRKNKLTTSVTSGFKVSAPAKRNPLVTIGQEENSATEKTAEALPVYVDQPMDENQFKSYPYGNTIALERNTKAGLQELKAQSSKQIAVPKINCPPVRGRTKWDDFNKDWYVDTYISPDYSLKTISNISATPQYLRQKDSSESMQVGFSAGVRLVKPLNDHVQLTTGLQYSQINQRYTYRSENEIKITTVITTRTIIRSPGDTVTFRDTSQVQTIGYKNNVVKNRFRSIDVPVLLGYQFGRGSVKVGINAGVILNVSSWAEGAVLDTSMAVVTLQKDNNVYKKKLGLSMYTGVQISKELNDDMTLFVEPYYRHSFHNMTTDNQPYQQKFGTAGVMMGVRWSLNRK